MRERLKALVEDPRFERFIIALVILNAVILGLETSPQAREFEPWLNGLDRLIIGIFGLEILSKIYAYRGRFFREPWRVFDFCVVTISIVPIATGFSVLRALRVLRVLRLISFVPAMRRVVEGLLLAIPGIGSIVLLMVLIFYVFAVMGVRLFGADHPELFGDLGKSLFSLFQLMTLENWPDGIVRPVMQTHWWALGFFLLFMVSTTFTILNLFIGIIVEAMQRKYEIDADEDREEMKLGIALLLEEVRELRGELGKVRREREPEG